MGWLRRPAKVDFPLHESTYVVLDTETTGFHKTNDRIVSIGLVRVHQGRIVLKTAVEWYVRLSAELGNSPEIHGITRENFEGALSEEQSLKRFNLLTKDAIMVAHYAQFDRDMLQELAKRAGGNVENDQWLDTMDLQVGLEPELYRNAELLKLDTLLSHFQIEAVSRHTALGDAYSTALLLQRQLALFKQRGITQFSAVPKPRLGLF